MIFAKEEIGAEPAAITGNGMLPMKWASETPVSSTTPAMPFVISDVVMMSPIRATCGLPHVPQTTTDPGGAGSNASRLRLGVSPFGMAARRPSGTGIARIVQAAPQNLAALGLSDLIPTKNRDCKPFLKSSADSVGTAMERSFV